MLAQGTVEERQAGRDAANGRDSVARHLPMSEKQLQAAVVAMARHLGWRVYHTFDSRRSDAGFPDLVLVRGSRLVFAELKTAKGPVSDYQARWLEALGATAAEVFLWRPADWADGTVERVLRAPEAAA